MDLDASPASRKRRLSSSITNNSDGDDDNNNKNAYSETPSKRLENSHGHPIARQTYHLNTPIILQSLAFSRLFVTSNFSLYNPHTSPIIICVTRENDSLYRDLWSVSYHVPPESTSTFIAKQQSNILLPNSSAILPSLYPISPDLQSLCIMPAEQTSTDLWSALQRTVPIFTTADLDEEAADEVRTFVDDVTSTPDLIVLFDASGRSIWSSEDLPLQLQTEWDSGTALRTHLSRALQSLLPREREGEAMDLA